VNEADDRSGWPENYFTYFTEIEEHFQRARGTSLFLLSPLDWALIETWKEAGVPLEAVLRGIDEAFEKWRARKNRTQQINSIAYCAQAVMTEAQRLAEGEQEGQPTAKPENAAMSTDSLRLYLEENAASLRAHAEPMIQAIGDSLAELAGKAEDHLANLEDLERRLTAMEDKVMAVLRIHQSEDDLLDVRRDLDAQLKPFRGKMTADQLHRLERQFLDRKLLEKSNLPRLSLFYMREI
jgi:hypothetical protein